MRGGGAGEERPCRTGLLEEKPLSAPSLFRCRGPWGPLPAPFPRGILRGLPCYDRPMTEALQDGLDRLKQRSEDLKAAIVAKKREAARLQKKRSQALEQQLRSVRSRLSSSGTQAPHPPPHRPRRSHGKGGPPPTVLLSQARPLPRSRPGPRPLRPPSQILRWRRSHLTVGVCTPRGLAARLVSPMAPGEASTRVRIPEDLPQELVGLAITVRARSGKSWDANHYRGRRAQSPTASWSVPEDSINEHRGPWVVGRPGPIVSGRPGSGVALRRSLGRVTSRAGSCCLEFPECRPQFATRRGKPTKIRAGSREKPLC